MESTPLDLSFLDEEPLNSCSIPGDQMDYGTLGNLSDAILFGDEIEKPSDLFNFDLPPSLNTVPNRESISSSSQLASESFHPYALDSGLGSPSDGRLYSSPSSSFNTNPDFYSQTINSFFTEEKDFPAWFSCGNFIKSPLSTEDVDSVLDTGSSISDDGDARSPLGSSPPDSPGSQATLAFGEAPNCDSPVSHEDLLTLTPSPFEIPVTNSLPCEEIPPTSVSPFASQGSPPVCDSPLYGKDVLSGNVSPLSPSYYEDVPYYSPPPSSSSPPPSPSSYKSDPISPVYVSLSPPPLDLFPVDESDGIQVPSSGTLVFATAGEAPSSSPPLSLGGGSAPCLSVSGAQGGGKEKKAKSFRTKKSSPYARAGPSTESTPLSLPTPADDDDVRGRTPPQPKKKTPPSANSNLSKKEKKKIQNKNAATRYRMKMKEEAEQRKQEEDELFEENCRLKSKVEDIQKEIQYLKNLLDEIGAVRTTTTTGVAKTVVVVASAAGKGRR